MDIAYTGEHLLPGQLGQIFIVLAFGASLLSFISYFFATQNKNIADQQTWQRMGRIGFWLNTIAILGMGACLFYILYNHYFEYHYAWSYTSRALPVYYIVSGFWNGQEGGFLLWMFWQAVLGNILIWKAGSWEKPVLTTVALSQVILTSMVLGIEFAGSRIGSSPFLLLRNALEAPIFKNPDYLSFIKDGKGMNPSLQNYWMIIHPPTLFLGIASMVVPFAFAVAGLWQRRYKEWVAVAIPYALFACMILGTGIIMGSFWAYESLNFGGFWAWDPVENASLFPWLVMIAALHVMIVFKNSGHSYFTATFLVMTSFVLVWYASFLARSGVLGESSVHAFTDLGMFSQLVFGIIVFLLLSAVLLIARWKELPITKKDEETYSREFWMFVGSVFLALSCFQLIAVTSFPVINKMFGTNLAPPTDPVKMYNIIQSAFAVVITLLSGFSQFLKYRKTDMNRFFIINGIYILFAGLITALICVVTGLYKLHWVFILVMLCSVYSIVANGKVFADAVKGKFKLAGSAVAHIGFGLMLVGALISAGTQKVVSENHTGEQYSAEFAKENNPKENIILYKNQPITMGEYQVTFTGDTVQGLNHYFNVDYKKVGADGKVKEEFTLSPNVQGNANGGGFTSSPDTKHYPFHDLYTHITMTNVLNAEPVGEGTENGEAGADDDKNYDPPMTHEMAIGDTVTYREGIIVLKGLNKDAKLQSIPLAKGDLAVGAQLEINAHGKTYQAEPVYLIKGSSVFDFPKKIEDLGLKLKFSKIMPEKGKMEIMIYQQPESKKKFIVMKAIEFPYINFLWAGTIIMVIGFLMSIFRRSKELKVS
ncbi:MAG: cytochrome C biogenesis protein [Sphingobacteriaceae bacterium]|nr:MAG: cytochrome C biogenesis protein [Sphingobacteriaceae bacterium]